MKHELLQKGLAEWVSNDRAGIDLHFLAMKIDRYACLISDGQRRDQVYATIYEDGLASVFDERFPPLDVILSDGGRFRQNRELTDLWNHICMASSSYQFLIVWRRTEDEQKR